MKGISPASHSSWYTETQLWILLHFHMDLKHTHILSLAIYAHCELHNFPGPKYKQEHRLTQTLSSALYLVVLGFASLIPIYMVI